jgi:hypothetical protein
MCSYAHSNIEIHHLNFSSRNMALILDWWIFTKYCYFQGHRSKVKVTGSNFLGEGICHALRCPVKMLICRSIRNNYRFNWTELLATVLSVLRFMDSDYHFGILWTLCFLFFFDLRILITPLVTFGHCVVCSS